jgi:hypothetical protein
MQKKKTLKWLEQAVNYVVDSGKHPAKVTNEKKVGDPLVNNRCTEYLYKNEALEILVQDYRTLQVFGTGKAVPRTRLDWQKDLTRYVKISMGDETRVQASAYLGGRKGHWYQGKVVSESIHPKGYRLLKAESIEEVARELEKVGACHPSLK